ncbi:MAG: SpoIIE family protein phosphatase, partial [Bacteroidia bacterium]|nr:SpoIIE family protein phosphatase [Bacteroidia bacterium]
KYDGKSFTTFSDKEGLANITVFSLLEDQSGNLWFGTRFGISKLTPSKSIEINDKIKSNTLTKQDIIFKNYTYAEGFLGIGVNAGKTMLQAKDGTIWIGAKDRLTAMHPENMLPDSIAPNIQLTTIELFNENIAWNNLENKKDSTLTLGNGVSVSDFNFDGLTKWYSLPENLSLAYNNNYLTFNFIGITMNQPKNVKYQYMLEGIDENWSVITNKSFASYGNLPHGSYTFKVKAMNSEGFWSAPYEYKFTIRPPWWKTWWAYSLYTLFAISMIFLIVWWNGRRLRARAVELKVKVNEATLEIKEQKHLIEKKHKEITDSINYAERIQRALLASKKLLDENLSDYFIMFKPKDVVSGDFYWAASTGSATQSNFLLCIADSTGHGVPGAIMSILNIAYLEKSVEVEKLSLPNEILNHTRTKIIETLKKDGSAEGGKDGMDGSLLSFDLKNNNLSCSSANNPVWIIRENKLIEIKGDRFPVGKHDRDKEPFTLHTFDLQKGDVVYALTDGFADQFGGERGKKFKYNQLQELLLSIAHEPMSAQNQKLNDVFENWKGNLEQVDDVTVVGIRV